MMLASVADALFIAWGIFVALVWLLAAVLAARDVKRKGGPAVLTFVLAIVFWPGGLYLWAVTRGRHQGRQMAQRSY